MFVVSMIGLALVVPVGQAADAAKELAAKFQVLVDVLNEVADGARESSDVDLLRAYEVWLKTGSRRAESLLRQSGVEPLRGHLSRRH
jgi:hypothetical protein